MTSDNQRFARYEPRETFSETRGMWGYRIWDKERNVFVSPWNPLLNKVTIQAERLETGSGNGGWAP